MRSLMEAIIAGRTEGAGGRSAARRAIGFLGGVYSYALEREMVSTNPCVGLKRPADRKRERRLTHGEFRDLCRALDTAVARGVWPPAVSAVRFTALSGWRIGEVLNLEWPQIDAERRAAVLPQTKSGRSVRVLSDPAIALLRDIPRMQSTVAFPSVGGRAITSFSPYWRRIVRGYPSLDGVTPHVLRHSFASEAAEMQYGAFIIAALLGHTIAGVTAGYTHVGDAALLAAANGVAQRIQNLMAGISSAA